MPTSYQMPLFSGLPVAFTHGQGAWLWDTKGKKYLDALAGIAVCGLGHAHPAVTAALCDQAGKLLHTSNWYDIPLQEQLAERLCKLSGMDNAFFCNSGAEANEAAIKLARLHGHQRDILTPGIIVTEGSFHGRTLATLISAGTELAGAYQGSTFPKYPGYAAVFEVEEVGSEVQHLHPGDLAYCSGPHRSFQRAEASARS